MDLLCFFCLVFVMPLCTSVYCASWSTAGKGLTSWLSFIVYNCEFVTFLWYPGSGVVLDCTDSGSLHPYLLCSRNKFV